MAEKDQQAALIREIQTRFERKLKENEISLLEYWQQQLERVGAMKPEGVAALQSQIKKVSEMMANRIRMLKREP
jgi:iron-sulfur cluster repair protein YtfE (RIC family)